ncbi:MAG: alpha,alpha-trehalase TreA [Williamsia sp.]|nr:alpha,alpha-trehalase TreA [Williamsia sp.]
MKRFFFLLLGQLCILMAYAQTLQPPEKVYGQLFKDVQMQRIFADGKTFVDCLPKRDPQAIVADYKAKPAAERTKAFLQQFVQANFTVPTPPSVTDQNESGRDVVNHIKKLWSVLKRAPDREEKGSSRLPLPYPYIVPGGRFQEIYYWDSYFTMLGLEESGEWETLENMVKNFAYIINTYGHIPNGSRTYYLSRSQPPFFALMVDLLATRKGEATYKDYGEAMQKEWNYYADKTAPTQHVVKMPDGSTLNRYYDQSDQPRQESYYEDYTLARKYHPEHASTIQRDLRTGAESGMDFSSRWFADGKTLATIQTTNYVPVDLNCLLYHLELALAKSYGLKGEAAKQQDFKNRAAARGKAIEKYCWSPALGFYTDFIISSKKQSTEITLASMAPFFLQVADKSHIEAAANTLQTKFLKAGGFLTSLKNTGEQWDAPNGWAPLEWMAIKGLNNYGQAALAKTAAERWIALNNKVYQSTGKLMEKYNVADTGLEAGGGEYPGQDGFGWTNGVLLKLIGMYGLKK